MDQNEVTIEYIENELLARKSAWVKGAELRELALLFAILKEGDSIRKLLAFTSYDSRFILGFTEELRARGLLFSGLGSQFVLRQCPGTEDLIAIVTGARPFEPHQQIVQKSEPKIGGMVMDDKCQRNEWCTKGYKHIGKCRQPEDWKGEKETGVARPVVAKNGNGQQINGTVMGQSQKSVEFAGGRLTLTLEANLFDLTSAQRNFVFGLIDQIQDFSGCGEN